MKKIFLLMCAITSFTLFGQKFTLTPEGFVNTDDTSKKYVVLEFPGKSQEELYNSFLINLNKRYKSAKNVISSVAPSIITINAKSANPIRRTSMHSFTNEYTETISFKDGKVKVDAPIFKLFTTDYGKRQEMYLKAGFSIDGSSFGIFDKKGKVKYEKAVEDLNNFANELLDYLKKSEEEQEW
ncbi:DUF4468 domain-containing protein [Ornithobacterium rhinotracheale]|uniref:DUF4468 domain-containing protein n=1 Tax=Ornithobacterium rhinotracheale TaxID=28251 RepID=UPI001FF5C47E|nr:DUF4468 domain-containing protein [Ornithobacterium rhinotracheale]MCK0203363.1 DUF4468 domain-containing protein [Ornithobacterium rhinotracheale]